MKKDRVHVLGNVVLLVAVLVSWKWVAPVEATNTPSLLKLDYADDGKQLKLLVNHREIGPVCELWCYEGGPFRYGTASRRTDGSVVFVHTSGKMTATTTFTAGEERVLMDVRVEGPKEELKQVIYMGPCMQFWHSDSFKRESSLVDFARRCFLYTVRGPVGLMDTARGRMKDFKPDAPENTPPYTQWYVPIGKSHPGDIWAFGASGDRPLHGLVGVTSKDGRWLAAVGCAHTRTLGQGWHDCIHHVPEMQSYLSPGGNKIRHRTVLYIMPNNKRKLLDNYHQDFPEEASPIRVSVGQGGSLHVESGLHNIAGVVDLSLNPISSLARPRDYQEPDWETSPWGGLMRRGSGWRMWAFPTDEALELWVSLSDGIKPDGVNAELGGKGWALAEPPRGVPALMRRTVNGSLLAVFMWERSDDEKPAQGIPSANHGTKVLRGRLYFQEGKLETVGTRWTQAQENWRHSMPYRMPVE